MRLDDPYTDKYEIIQSQDHCYCTIQAVHFMRLDDPYTDKYEIIQSQDHCYNKSCPLYEAR